MTYSRHEQVVAFAISSATDVFDTENVNMMLVADKAAKTKTKVNHVQFMRLFVRELTRTGVNKEDSSVVDALRRFEEEGIYSYAHDESTGYVTYMPGVFWEIYGPVLDEINKSRND